MAMSPEEVRWEGHKRRLKTRRPVVRRRSDGRSTAGSQFSDGRSTANSTYSNPAGQSRGPPQRSRHGYNSRNPAVLPRLDTPPAHNHLHTESDLRRSSYEQVPPVSSRRQKAVRSMQDAGYYDDGEESWGEDAASDEEEEEEFVPRMYPYPMMGPVPYYPSPAYIYAPPPPMAYPSRRHKKKQVTYQEYPNYMGRSSPPLPKQNLDTKQKNPVPYNPFDPNDNPVLQRYQYPTHREKRSRLVPFYYQPHTLFDESVPWKKASARFLSDILFAEELVEEFVFDTLDDEIIPNILIEEISVQSSSKIAKDHPYFWPSLDVCVNFLDEEMPQVIRGIVIEATNELVSEYFGRQKPGNPVGQAAEQIIAEVVHDEANKIVRRAIQELVDSHLNKASAYDAVTDVIADVVSELAPPVAQEALQDVLTEDFRDTDVILSLVKEMSKEVAMETLKDYEEKQRKKQEKEVAVYAEGKLLDSFCLDYLASVLGRQAQVWAREEAAGKIMDVMTLDLLLKQYFSISDERKATLDNKPMRHFQEKCFTDVALHVLMKELGATLDEDMADLDEYEQGLWNPAHSQAPEWAIHR